MRPPREALPASPASTLETEEMSGITNVFRTVTTQRDHLQGPSPGIHFHFSQLSNLKNILHLHRNFVPPDALLKVRERWKIHRPRIKKNTLL